MRLGEVRQSDVKNPKSFATFCHQNFGTPSPTISDLKMLGKQAKLLFAREPGTDWQTLIDVARWCHANKRRVARVHFYVDQFKWAWAAGGIEVADYVDEDVKSEIDEALRVETDPIWRGKLMRADGNAAKLEVLNRWKQQRSIVQ